MKTIYAKDCFEAGLFTTGLLWSDKTKKPHEFEVVRQQVYKSFKNLKIKTKYITVIEKNYIGTNNINDKLKNVANGIEWINKNIKKKIQHVYGLKGADVFQTGEDLSNLIFACELLDKSLFNTKHHKDIQFLSLYLKNFQLSIQSIGNPNIAEDFTNNIKQSISNPKKINYLSKVTTDGFELAPQLAIWIESNLVIEKKKNSQSIIKTIWKIVAGLIVLLGGIWTVIKILSFFKIIK